MAAVDNDIPAAPAKCPAPYLGVLAVAIGARARALLHAGKAMHLDFAPLAGIAVQFDSACKRMFVRARCQSVSAVDPAYRTYLNAS